MNKLNWPKYLKECCESTQFMALATHGPQGLWNHAVFFAYDKQLNFYFLSEPGSRHMQNLAAHSEVALAIFSTDQFPGGDVLGMQVNGTAEILADDQIEAAFQIYDDRSPKLSDASPDLAVYRGSAAAWKFVKVIPNEIGYFDTRHFTDRQIVPKGVTL
jgi:uncharacterized protein YhbP (UPF0306 family)